MEHVLYADILFFINFSMDFITLYLTSRLTSGPPAGIRSVIAAAVGGIYGTAAVAAGIDGIIGVLAAGAVSAVMVLIAFGFGGGGVFLRRSAVFWGFAALLGGVMTAICSFGDFGAPGTPAGGTALLFAGSTLCLLIMRVFTHFRRRRAVRIAVEFGGRRAEFDALADSGNLVTDPLSAKPVIIADASVLRGIVPELCADPSAIPDSLASRIRMIPVKGIGGRGMLTGFIPDSVTVFAGGRGQTADAVIAMTDAGAGFFGGYPANAPGTLL